MAWNRDDRRGGDNRAPPAQVEERFRAIQAEITSRQAEIEFLLGGDIAVDAFMRAITVALRGNEFVLSLSPDSIVDACLEAAQDRLLPDGTQGAIVPRKSKKTRRIEATWQPMYQGLLHLAKKYGGVRDVICELVFEGERFKKYAGTNPRIEHEQEPELFNLDKLRAGYVIFLRHDGTFYDEVMSRTELLAVRDNTDGYNSPNASPWKGPFAGEMFKKTLINRAWKRFGASVTGAGAEILQRAVNRVYGDQMGMPPAPDTLTPVGVERTRIDERALPAPPVMGAAAQPFSLEQDKIDVVSNQLAAISTKDEFDAYLNTPGFINFRSRLERNSARHPEVLRAIEVEIDATRARVDPESRDDGEQGFPIFCPNHADPFGTDWVLESAPDIETWQRWWGNIVKSVPQEKAKLYRANAAHFKSIASASREHQSAVNDVMALLREAVPEGDDETEADRMVNERIGGDRHYVDPVDRAP